MNLGPDGMAPTEAMKTRQRKTKYWIMAVVVVANITVLTWTFWPHGKESYEDCQVRVAEKAKGNATIFLHLKSSVCQPLKPSADDFLSQ